MRYIVKPYSKKVSPFEAFIGMVKNIFAVIGVIIVSIFFWNFDPGGKPSKQMSASEARAIEADQRSRAKYEAVKNRKAWEQSSQGGVYIVKEALKKAKDQAVFPRTFEMPFEFGLPGHCEIKNGSWIVDTYFYSVSGTTGQKVKGTIKATAYYDDEGKIVWTKYVIQ